VGAALCWRIVESALGRARDCVAAALRCVAAACKSCFDQHTVREATCISSAATGSGPCGVRLLMTRLLGLLMSGAKTLADGCGIMYVLLYCASLQVLRPLGPSGPRTCYVPGWGKRTVLMNKRFALQAVYTAHRHPFVLYAPRKHSKTPRTCG
jgi:hypothetical protein